MPSVLTLKQLSEWISQDSSISPLNITSQSTGEKEVVYSLNHLIRIANHLPFNSNKIAELVIDFQGKVPSDQYDAVVHKKGRRQTFVSIANYIKFTSLGLHTNVEIIDLEANSELRSHNQDNNNEQQLSLKERELQLEKERLEIEGQRINLRNKELDAEKARFLHEKEMKELDHKNQLELLERQTSSQKTPPALPKRISENSISPARTKIPKLIPLTIIQPTWNQSKPASAEQAICLLLSHCLIPTTQKIDLVETHSVVRLIKAAALQNILQWPIPSPMVNPLYIAVQKWTLDDFCKPILKAKGTYKKLQILNMKAGMYLTEDYRLERRISSVSYQCFTHLQVNMDVLSKMMPRHQHQ